MCLVKTVAFPCLPRKMMLEDAGCIWLDTWTYHDLSSTWNFTLVVIFQQPSPWKSKVPNQILQQILRVFQNSKPHLKLQGSQGGVCWSRFDVDLELPNVQQGCQQLGGGWHEDHGCQEVTNLHFFSQSHGTYL